MRRRGAGALLVGLAVLAAVVPNVGSRSVRGLPLLVLGDRPVPWG